MSNDESAQKTNTSLFSDNTIKGLFITSIASLSALISFSYALTSAKKRDNTVYDNNVAQLHASGSQLAVRALKWGTFYAVTGCGLIIFSVWKLVNAKDMNEFRQKMGSIFPAIPKNNPPQSRIDFKTISEFMQYLDDEYSTKNVKEVDNVDSINSSKVE